MDFTCLLQEITDTSSEEELEMDEVGVLTCETYYVNLLEAIKKRPRTAIEFYMENVVAKYNDAEFIRHFRMSRTTSNNLAEMYKNSSRFCSLGLHGGRSAVNSFKQILVFLWYVGHESGGYAEMLDKFDLAYSTLYNIIDRVALFLCDLGPNVIKYPNEEQKLATMAYFFDSFNFPGIIGAVDGTHIKIDQPSEDPDSYMNRKKFFSLHLQGVVDHNRKFIDVFCGYPGSCHDARVFKCSPLYEDLQFLCRGDSPRYLIGDTAYPCLKTLLVPFKDNGHLSNTQKRFNHRLSQCRIKVEHAFGILKQRFRKMYHLNVRERSRQLRIIYSCCVLHNLASEDDIAYLEAAAENEDDLNSACDSNLVDDINITSDFNQDGRNLRTTISENIF